METESYPNSWLQVLDMVGMVIATLIFPSIFFLLAFQSYETSMSTGTGYIDTIVLFFVVLLSLICLGYFFGKGIKSYVYHQTTREDVKIFRIVYSGLILGSLYMYYLLFFI